MQRIENTAQKMASSLCLFVLVTLTEVTTDFPNFCDPWINGNTTTDRRAPWEPFLADSLT